MSDLISKQRAIEAIDRFIPADPMMSDYTQGISVGLAIATRCIEEFSQENDDSSQGLVKDLIRRQDAIDALGKEPKFKIKMIKTYAEGRSDQWFKDVASIASLPSVESTIIRCRDCKHHDGIRCFRWNSTIITGFDDFCSNAEKRGEEDE